MKKNFWVYLFVFALVVTVFRYLKSGSAVETLHETRFVSTLPQDREPTEAKEANGPVKPPAPQIQIIYRNVKELPSWADVVAKHGGVFDLNDSAQSDGYASSLTGAVPLRFTPGESRAQIVADFLAELGRKIKIDDPRQLQLGRFKKDAYSEDYTFLQNYKGIPVEGSLVKVQLNLRNEVVAITSQFVMNVKDVNTTEAPGLDAVEAVKRVSSLAGGGSSQGPTEKVILMDPQSGRPDLYWRVHLTRFEQGIEGANTYYMNAHDGAVIKRRAGVD